MDSKEVSSEVYTEEYYLQRCGGVEFFDRYKQEILKPMMQLAVKRAELQPGMRILDVGCGRGELVAYLTKRGYDAIGIDYAKDAIGVAKKHFPASQFFHGDLYELKFDSHSFDCVFFLGTVEHLYDAQIEKIAEEFVRLLKPGGCVVLTTCTNAYYFKNWTYKFRLSGVKFLNSLGFNKKIPSPPRSEEDTVMHVNEQNYFSLKNHFSRYFKEVHVEPRLNPKLCLQEIYGNALPADFPLRAASQLKQSIYKGLRAIPFLNLIITRANLIVLKNPIPT